MFGWRRRAFSLIRSVEWKDGSVVHPFACRQISQFERGKRAFLVDTLALVITSFANCFFFFFLAFYFEKE